MSPEQRLKAEDLLSTIYPEMIPIYLRFLAQTDPFPKLRFREEARQVSSTVWWKSLTGSKVSEDFIFSTFAHVHNKVRNRHSVILRGNSTDDID